MITNIQDVDCEMTDYFCDGVRIGPNNGTSSESWEVCGRMCLETTKCYKWHFYKGQCYMYEGCTFTRGDPGNVAGTKECPGGKIQIPYVNFLTMLNMLFR